MEEAERAHPQFGKLIMFFSRGKTEARHLEWRMRLFGIGGGLGIGGVWLDNSWLIWGALVVLFAGVALRFAGGGDAAENDDAAEKEADEMPHEDS